MKPRNLKNAFNRIHDDIQDENGNLKKTQLQRQESSESQLSSDEDSIQKIQEKSKIGKAYQNVYKNRKDGNQYEYSQQSEQSQIQQQDQQFEQSQRDDLNLHQKQTKYNQTKKPLRQMYEMQAESQQSQQDSSQFQFNEQQVKNRIGIDMKKMGDQQITEHNEELDEESEEEDSIDYIEQRIKKLQKDLQERLGKHQPSNSSSSQKAGVPIQKKIDVSNKVSQESSSFDKKNQVFMKKNQIGGKKLQPPLPKKQQFQPGSSIVKQTIKEKEAKQIEKVEKIQKIAMEHRQRQIVNNTNLEKAGVIKKKSVNRLSQGRQNLNNINLIEQNITPSQKQKANSKKTDNKKQFEQMQRKIEQLTQQNKRLKLKTSHTSSLDIHAKKKKPNQQLQKLKQFSETFNVENSEKNQKIQQKLNKEIELLQVLQRLQSKLKASIKRNMGKLKKDSSTLLHKGVSSGFLRQN